MSDDPFDDLDADAHRDREGDPFDDLDADPIEDSDAENGPDSSPSVPETGSGDGVEEASAARSDPFEYMDDGPDAGDSEDGVGSRPDGERADRSVDVAGDAFGDVDVSRGDPFEGSDSAFERVDVDSVDPDAVWDRFTEDTEAGDDPEATLGGESVPEDAPDTVTVPKGRFCQTCPHFTAPPETTCTHEGTEIIRFVGSDDVRVRNCPIVDERRELGETYE